MKQLEIDFYDKEKMLRNIQQLEFSLIDSVGERFCAVECGGYITEKIDGNMCNRNCCKKFNTFIDLIKKDIKENSKKYK